MRSNKEDDGTLRPWVLVNRPTYVVPEFGLFMDHNLGKRIEMGYNAGFKWTGMYLDDKKSSKNPDFFYTARVLFHAAKPLDVYAEHFGFIRKVYYPTLGMNLGARYAITRKFVVDVNGGLGFNSASPDAFAGLGLSYKLGK
ncbi:MAG: transporter [Chitinophagales bacterium]|nr:transporter [Chitinophagales bacterium]